MQSDDLMKKMDEMEVHKDESKSLYLFGRDVAEIPCFRNSFLYGISTGIASGLGFFMFTSRTRRATHVAFGSFMLTTFAYWCTCRYNYAVTKFQMLQVKRGLKEKMMHEGTSLDQILEETSKETGLDIKTV